MCVLLNVVAELFKILFRKPLPEDPAEFGCDATAAAPFIPVVDCCECPVCTCGIALGADFRRSEGSGNGCSGSKD